MSESAFGVEHIEKAAPLGAVKSLGAMNTAGVRNQIKGIKAAKRAAGMSTHQKVGLGAGIVAGGAVGGAINHKVTGSAFRPAILGPKKQQIGKSAFGIEHVEKAMPSMAGVKALAKPRVGRLKEMGSGFKAGVKGQTQGPHQVRPGGVKTSYNQGMNLGNQAAANKGKIAAGAGVIGGGGLLTGGVYASRNKKPGA